MPLTNRVDPFGRIFATSARGMFMGSRGCIHDENKQLRGQAWSRKFWIICQLEFGDRKRELMAPGQYTELFFLDEATALSAGHRPCAECQRGRYREFMTAYAAAHPEAGPKPRAPVLDAALHAERISAGGGRPTWRERLEDLPDGAMVEVDGNAWLIWKGNRLRWSPQGYDAGAPIDEDRVGQVLTPLSTIGVLRQGYLPVLHPTSAAF